MRFMRLSEVIAITGLCQSSIYNRMALGQFPRSVSLGGRAVAWVSDEVDQWMAARIEERDSHKSLSLIHI